MTETEQIEKKKKKNRFHTDFVLTSNPLYEEPKFIERMDELYANYSNFNLVAKKLNEEFKEKNCSISRQHLMKLYKTSMANKFEGKKADDFFKDSYLRMQRRWEDTWEMVGDLVEQYKKFKKVAKERSQDEWQEALNFLRFSGQIIQIAKAVQDQMTFIQKQQDEIKTYQQNNLIVSPIQVNQYIQKFWSDVRNMSNEDLKNFLNSTNDKRLINLAKDL